MSEAKLSILTIGLEPENEKALKAFFKLAAVQKQPMNNEALLSPISPAPHLILTGMPKDPIKPNELAQSLRMHYQDTPIYLLSASREGFERKTFIKNGFSDAFLLPMDLVNLQGLLNDLLAKVSSGAIPSFRPVKIIDVEANEVLEFETNVYLPANDRYVKFGNAGEALDDDKLGRLKKSKLNNVYVPSEQMTKFYQYSAKRLRALGEGTFSVTERKEKLSQAVRDLISGLFTQQSASFESGQAVLKDCGEIVKTYILQGADTEWYSRIIHVLGERGDSYSHAGNTSTLAALFSMGLGVGKPEEMALAGLLHDIGIAELPADIQALEPEDMNKDQFEHYKRHPELSVQLIKARKIIIPENVSKAILQHHEFYNGTGYPSGIFGDRITKEAQILALANTFDDLTKLIPGKPYLTPLEAVEKLREEQVNDPAQIHYNPELLKKLLTLFPNPKAT